MIPLNPEQWHMDHARIWAYSMTICGFYGSIDRIVTL